MVKKYLKPKLIRRAIDAYDQIAGITFVNMLAIRKTNLLAENIVDTSKCGPWVGRIAMLSRAHEQSEGGIRSHACRVYWNPENQLLSL